LERLYFSAVSAGSLPSSVDVTPSSATIKCIFTDFLRNGIAF
jgi:hypothetical protein